MRAVVVMGHTSCGGVAAAIKYANYSSWVPTSTLDYYLTPLVNIAKGFISDREHSADDHDKLSEIIMRLNVQMQLTQLSRTDVVQGNWNGTPSPLTGKVMERVSLHGYVAGLAPCSYLTGRLNTDPGVESCQLDL